MTAAAVSGGMTFDDGTPESSVTLSMALILKDKLLAKGYDVLMIRETEDVQLDNIARTLIANNASDCHIYFTGIPPPAIREPFTQVFQTMPLTGIWSR